MKKKQRKTVYLHSPMLTLLEEEPAGIIEFKGKQYIKKGIPQND